MASTKNLQDTVSWAAPFFKYMPQETGSFEPMLTSANMTKQMIIGPPFAWRWNRNSVTYKTIAGQQDYVVSIPDFNFLEKASVSDPTASIFEIEEMGVLGETSEQNRPDTIAAQDDDNNGNITFRMSTVPDQAYGVTLTYQRKPSLLTSLASNWYPIPDEMSYLANWGYVTFMAMCNDDARFPTFSQRFVAHLLGAQDAISDISRNLFLNNWTAVQSQAQRIQQTTAQGVQARGV